MSALSVVRYSEPDDDDLLVLLQQGSGAGFSRLVEQYHERVFATVYAVVGNREDADDLTQEVFVRVYRSVRHFRGQSRLYTWIYRIGINCCRDWIKRKERRRSVTREPGWWDLKEEQDGLFQQPEAPDEQVSRRLLRERLEKALAGLPTNYRLVLVMRELDGLPYEEIASALGCSLGTVKSRLSRARAMLREILAPAGRSWLTG